MDLSVYQKLSPSSVDLIPAFKRYKESIAVAVTAEFRRIYIERLNSSHQLPVRFTKGFQAYFASRHSVDLSSLMKIGSSGLPKDRCMFPGCPFFMCRMGVVGPKTLGLAVDLSQHFVGIGMIPAFHKSIEAVDSNHSSLGVQEKIDLVVQRVESAQCLLPPLSLQNPTFVAGMSSVADAEYAIKKQKAAYHGLLAKLADGDPLYVKATVTNLVNLEEAMSFRCLEVELLRVLAKEGIVVNSVRASTMLFRCDWSGRFVVVRD